MFLRNYDNYLIATHLSSKSDQRVGDANSDFRDGVINQKTPSGVCTQIWLTECSPNLIFNKLGICFGNGNTAVTYEDYRLSGNTVSNKLVDVATSRIYNTGTKKWKVIYTGTYYNSTATDITISEWGLCRSNSSISIQPYDVGRSDIALVFREVLETPIVIEAGTTATLRFTLDIPMPNHP